jgi:hypothetical protein
MERRIDISSKLMPECVRIAFLLPKKGNDVEFMTLDRCHGPFQAIMNVAIGEVERVEWESLEERRKLKVEDDREDRYQQYLALKEEFGNEN